MKKLFIFLLLILFFSSSVSLALAQEVSPSPKQNMATAPAQIQYALAYPGVLPDNPLFSVKALRDKLVSFLINDPIKKAEFNLLTSDKRIAAAAILADRGKAEIALTTLSKSNNYMDAGISSVREAKSMGRSVDTVLHNLALAIKKHQQVASTMQKKLGKKFSAQLQAELSRLNNFEKAVNKLLPKK